MKKKVLALILSAGLMVFLIAGCGLKLPSDSSPSPSGSDTGSPSGDTSALTTTVGVVHAFDSQAIKLDLATLYDMQSSGESQIVTIGSAVYVLTGATRTVTFDADVAVIFESQGYAPGAIEDIAAGDFLAIVMRGDTVISIINSGQAVITGTDGDDQPTPPEPTDSGATASPSVPDSSEPATYMITTDGLKIRSGPGTTYNAVGVLDTGSRETGTVTDGWLKFTYDGKDAYISAEFIKPWTLPEGVPDASASKTYKTTDNVNVRTGPGTTYESLGKLEKGTEVTGTVADGWLKFTYNDNTSYCSAAFLTAG